jgi:hypothetical protein
MEKVLINYQKLTQIDQKVLLTGFKKSYNRIESEHHIIIWNVSIIKILRSKKELQVDPDLWFNEKRHFLIQKHI